ncbi:STAS domain-containing protein [Melioribacteraceae bacterium 4301-Me]|uniref:STAS domain-containing protein n=1 Tax=Pyranulibacter aquaticus TaxID=3163344 RepID=UPI00359B681F
MKIFEEIIDDIVVEVVNVPRATLSESEELKSLVYSKIDNGYKKIIVDLTSCEFIDSSFLGALVSTLKRATKNGGDLKLVGLQPTVRAMFELTRLFRVFDTFTELQEAVRSFQSK